MLSKQRTRTIAAVVVLGATVAGCSDMYFDRRDMVSLGAGDAIATNKIAQMVDPWPRYSGRTHIAYNGQRTQLALDRYNRGKAITPVLPTTTSKDYLSVQPAAAVKGPGAP
jgi:hypothetical protein